MRALWNTDGGVRAGGSSLEGSGGACEGSGSEEGIVVKTGRSSEAITKYLVRIYRKYKALHPDLEAG